eukprot:1143339-Karenia_brevis.AAC.1
MQNAVVVFDGNATEDGARTNDSVSNRRRLLEEAVARPALGTIENAAADVEMRAMTLCLNALHALADAYGR